MKRELLNSTTDGNTLGIEETMRKKYRGVYDLFPAQSLSGPDSNFVEYSPQRSGKIETPDRCGCASNRMDNKFSISGSNMPVASYNPDSASGNRRNIPLNRYPEKG